MCVCVCERERERERERDRERENSNKYDVMTSWKKAQNTHLATQGQPRAKHNPDEVHPWALKQAFLSGLPFSPILPRWAFVL